VERLGRLVVLVNNAGVNDSVPLTAAPADFLGSLQRNLLHVFSLTHHARAHLIAAKGNVERHVAETAARVRAALDATGARYAAERVVEHLPQRIITAAGVSSGIDMGLRLVELLVDRHAAQASQLMIEYDPQPPFDSGALAKASEATVLRAQEYFTKRS
jgi:NAD(P)-dependent dehydrogenase (short-subunit alcohol dehydrogenase family)